MRVRRAAVLLGVTGALGLGLAAPAMAAPGPDEVTEEQCEAGGGEVQDSLLGLGRDICRGGEFQGFFIPG